MIFFGRVSAAGILELDHPELYGDLLKGRLATAVYSSTSTGRKHPARSNSLRTCSQPCTRRLRSTLAIQSLRFTKSASRCSCRNAPCRSAKGWSVPGSTARLTTGEMMDYIDDALRSPASWAALCRPQRRRDLLATRPQP
jgi:hypothetical protein